MDTSPDYLTLWFALAKIGAVEIPINTAYHGGLLSHQLANSAATVCVADEEYASRVSEVAPDVPGLARLYVRGEDRGSPATIAHGAAAARLRRAAGR